MKNPARINDCVRIDLEFGVSSFIDGNLSVAKI